MPCSTRWARWANTTTSSTGTRDSMGGAIWEWEDQGLWNRRDPKHAIPGLRRRLWRSAQRPLLHPQGRRLLRPLAQAALPRDQTGLPVDRHRAGGADRRGRVTGPDQQVPVHRPEQVRRPSGPQRRRRGDPAGRARMAGPRPGHDGSGRTCRAEDRLPAGRRVLPARGLHAGQGRSPGRRRGFEVAAGQFALPGSPRRRRGCDQRAEPRHSCSRTRGPITVGRRRISRSSSTRPTARSPQIEPRRRERPRCPAADRSCTSGGPRTATTTCGPMTNGCKYGPARPEAQIAAA